MRRLLASCFGLGWLPFCPGTFGSLPPALIFALLCHFRTSALAISIVMAVLVLAGSFICVKFSPAVITATGRIDPREIVADEFAGQSVTFLFICLLSGFWNVLSTTIAGFLLFRLFDITKPWPIRQSQKLPQGWGILADDLLAGVYAAIVLLVCIRLWIAGYLG